MITIIIIKIFIRRILNMSLVGKQVQPFKAQAYQNGKFIEVT